MNQQSIVVCSVLIRTTIRLDAVGQRLCILCSYNLNINHMQIRNKVVIIIIIQTLCTFFSRHPVFLPKDYAKKNIISKIIVKDGF